MAYFYEFNLKRRNLNFILVGFACNKTFCLAFHIYYLGLICHVQVQIVIHTTESSVVPFGSIIE